MSNQKKSILAGTIVLAGFAVILGVISSKTDPQPGFAQAAPAPAPDVSIVFVIDGSRSLVGPEGLRYFSLAKDGVAEFLSRPHFPLDTTFEVSVMQFTKRTAPRYEQGQHYILPTQITASNVNTIIGQVERLARSTHATASLLEMGLWEAKKVWDVGGGSNADANTDKHIILLTSGEYQLPKPAPPENYTCGTNCPSLGTGTTDNRARPIRTIAKAAREDGIFVSSLQVGPEWHRDNETPYDDASGDFDYCESSPPILPDRGELLKDVSNFEGDCGGESIGSFNRINPLECYACGISDFVPGTEYDIADAVGWTICKAAADGGNYDDNVDADFLYGDANIPLHRICDNCPDDSNKRQRDCNRDGYGDVCQFTTTHCGTGIGDTDDSDDDGLCDGLDTCPNGDDCLVSMWAERVVCPSGDCSCDCDHDGLPDECIAAVDLEARQLLLPIDDLNDADSNGVPDFCEDENTKHECTGFPDECNLDFQQSPFLYVEDFENGPGGDILDVGGWGISLSESDPDYDEAVTKAFWITPPVICGEDHGKAVLFAPVGDSSYYIESPGIALPAWECGALVNGNPNNETLCYAKTGSIDPTGWGAFAVDIDLFFAATPWQGQSEFDLLIRAPCEDEALGSTRAHLKFVSRADPEEERGDIYMAAPELQSDPNYLGMVWVGDYHVNTWFTLTMRFNEARNFDNDCNWTPQYDVHVVKSWGQKRPLDCPVECDPDCLLSCPPTCDATEPSSITYPPDVHGFSQLDKVRHSRNVQVRIAKNGHAGWMMFDNISIQEITACEFWTNDNQAGTHGCPVGEECTCAWFVNYGHRWSCTPEPP